MYTLKCGLVFLPKHAAPTVYTQLISNLSLYIEKNPNAKKRGKGSILDEGVKRMKEGLINFFKKVVGEDESDSILRLNVKKAFIKGMDKQQCVWTISRGEG